MSIVVSQPFKDAIDDKLKVVVIEEIRYLRRIKPVSGGSFLYESTEIILEESEFIAVSPLVSKFDVQKQNVILVSNLTLTLDNRDFQWDEFNKTFGKFKPTALNPAGFDPYLSEFKVRFGVVTTENPDTPAEQVQMFIGRVVDYAQDSESGGMQFFLKGLEIKLQSVDSQKVNNIFTDEATDPATGDGTNPLFKSKKSIFEISKVRTATVAKIQGADFKLAKISDADFEAEITFEPAAIPGAGAAVDFTGRQWKGNITVSAFLGLVADAAGIPPSQREISEPNYPDISQFIDYGTQAEWDASILTQLVAVAGKLSLKPFDVIDDFESGLGAWTVESGTWADLSFLSSTRLATNSSGTSTENRIRRASTKVDGAWDWTHAYENPATSNVVPSPLGGAAQPKGAEFQFMVNAGGDFYAWRIRADSGIISSPHTVTLVKSKSGETVLGSFAIPSGAYQDDTVFNWRVTRNNSTGEMKIYQNGVLKITASDTAITTSVNFKFRGNANDVVPSGRTRNYFDDLKTADTIIAGAGLFPSSGTALTAEIDLLVTPTGLQAILLTALLNGGAVALKTQSSVLTGGPFSTLVATDGSNVPQSPLRRFWKVELTLTPNVGQTATPEIDLFRFQFLSTELLIGQANTSGKNGYQAYQRVAEITGSEFGFKNTGVLFFRPKTVGNTPILEITNDDYIIRVRPSRPGWKDVKNVIQVNYGSYYSEVNSTTKGEAEPTSQDRFGDKILALTINDFLFANNANFSEAIAELLYDQLSQPKRKVRIECRLIPFLALSDVIRAQYKDSELADPVYSDKLNQFPTFGPSGNVLLRDFVCKIIGIEHDFKNARTHLDVEEVLT